MNPIQVGLLGIGTVGGGTFKVLQRNQAEIRRRAGRGIQITMVADLDTERARSLVGPEVTVVGDARQVIANPDIDIVIELIGGYGIARALVLEAIAAGKHVVTANKALLAVHGTEIFEAASAKGVVVAFEAAVAGGIPIIKPLRESLAGDRVRKVLGILNGTTNYILTRMTEEGLAFDDALAEAQALGYAEADPTADVDGHDAASKAAIIASLAFDAEVVADDVACEGIRRVSATDIAHARRMGYVIKLLAIVEERDGTVGARVHPALVPVEHPLASVRESFNAVFVEAEAADELMFYGRGAGSLPTASAVVGDIVTAARALRSGERAANGSSSVRKPIQAFADVRVQHYVLLDVADQPGVLAAVARSFGDHGVSIKSVWQEGTGDRAQLLLITHAAREGDLQSTLGTLRGLSVVRDVASVIRVEGGEV
jgi:homoserine dehydrogenase